MRPIQMWVADVRAPGFAAEAHRQAAAVAAGEADRRGFLLPGYPADLTVLSHDITRIAPMRLYDVEVLATVLAGRICYLSPGFSL